MDEFALIERLKERFEAATEGGRRPGETWIGDDAAVVQVGVEPVVLATDLVVEGVHVDLSICSPSDAGFKALMVTLSDLAAMGALPDYALVSIAAPEGTDLEQVGAGLAEAAGRTGCRVVGGDLSAGPVLVVSVAALGRLDQSAEHPALLRSGAHPGDLLFATGPLGGAAAGLRLLRAGRGEEHPGPAERHRRPIARLEAGSAARLSGATAAIDVSDGLVADAGHLAEASEVGIALDQVPVDEGATLDEALHGGEDYELVVATGAPDLLVAAFERAGLARPLPIGRCTATAGERTLRGEPLAGGGWRHTF